MQQVEGFHALAAQSNISATSSKTAAWRNVEQQFGHVGIRRGGSAVHLEISFGGKAYRSSMRNRSFLNSVAAGRRSSRSGARDDHHTVGINLEYARC